MSYQSPQFILTVLILAGFAGFVTMYMLVDLSASSQEVIKQIVISMGQACLLVVGWWFVPNKKD